jgi:hypothetical protein
MKRFLSAVVVPCILVCGFLASAREARAETVGLGVGAGVVIPVGADNPAIDTSLETNFGYGFFVDIPLLASFHLTPSAMVYRLNDKGDTASDMSLAFKFILTTPFIRPYAGLQAGTTIFGAGNDISVGFLGGVAFNLIANLDAFAQGTYSVIIRDGMTAANPTGGNVKVAHVTAGALFRFH